ncbi:methionine-R-sulfoxide reductase B3 isoform X6 [Meleagris gallopavo]|uniref:methionine-R-sulfoxide reductase B3 isoform X6 n=1 Tax=Meleagris gallopavo TaxID=9103 RepID=UPI0012AC2DCD|nr:methionine-R-sulfoxide reductase B3 isoform X6 [Meleagris gallopavo]
MPSVSLGLHNLLPLFFASGFVGEDITVMSAFNLLHLVTKSQPVALRACGLPSAFRNAYHQRCMITGGSSRVLKENKSETELLYNNAARSCRDKKDCKVVFSQEELRKRLTPLQYHVTQEKGTESAFEGEYTHHKAQGIYKCVVCGTPLFKSETKFDSNSGLYAPPIAVASFGAACRHALNRPGLSRGYGHTPWAWVQEL